MQSCFWVANRSWAKYIAPPREEMEPVVEVEVALLAELLREAYRGRGTHAGLLGHIGGREHGATGRTRSSTPSSFWRPSVSHSRLPSMRI